MKGQNKWVDLNLPYLRRLDAEYRLPCPGEIAAVATKEEAFTLLIKAFGCENQSIVERVSKIGSLIIERDKLEHIVEKRQDARERYVNYA